MEDLKAQLVRIVQSLESDARRLEGKVDALMRLPDMIEVENLVKTMAWAMDTGNKDLWLSIWTDDIHYIVRQLNIDITGKEAMKDLGDTLIFGREERSFSALSNIMVDVKGDTASGRAYYTHYGFPMDAETGRPLEQRSFSEGMHFYEFRKERGAWKIAKLQVYLNRRQEAEA
jgi:ketosteroid isomerase-like protein